MCRDDPGYIVHHKVWLTPQNIDDPDVALNPANFLYVCHDCHKKIENDGGNLYYFDEQGQPQPLDASNSGSGGTPPQDRESTRLESSHLVNSYAGFCFKKKKKKLT